MHAIFIPYGIKAEVEHLLMDMQAQKFPLTLIAPDGKKQVQWIQGSLRILPFGVYEYVFPREVADAVLSALNFHQREGDRYSIGLLRKFLLRYVTKADPIPTFNKMENIMRWYTDNVEIIPIGVRYDVDCIVPEGTMKGWKHEAI